ncbi:DNA-binding transcriptional regulator, Lrp family [Methylobacterium sp. 174MFSha1.1]|uniref:Lrp/AsnC family transcriptional regulator n=1 Tax=Methylobacterium sp. 174MFSha1.1 TaxID=1502749 RepID=UPI0008E49244|nr:Lrp/AsnC family transcriptional regulator [Methylobacterium sp. 174MFSha1.1]SFU88487.1 DNA-binding transcriptional regulator, Lrp family [Methylobacterium sp. 174MFSha1.1]
MDVLDQNLVTLLRHDCRRPVSELAVLLKVSRATVRARLDRLERDGEIVGYTVVLRADAMPAAVRAITLVAVEGRKAGDVIDALKGFAEITAVHTTVGTWDIVVEVAAGSLPELDEMLRRVRLVPGVTTSETHLLLSTPRSARARL